MKRTLVITLALVLALSLVACGGSGGTPSGSTSTPPQNSIDTTPQTSSGDSNSMTPSPSGSTSESSTPTVIVSGEVSPVEVEIDGVPTEVKMGIGNPLYAMELSNADPFTAGWLAAYDGVSQDDFDKYSDYFDTLPGSDKSGESGQATYNFDWGAVQIAHNAENKQLNVTWLVY